MLLCGVCLCVMCASVWCVPLCGVVCPYVMWCVPLCAVCLCGVCTPMWCVCASVSVCDGSQKLTFVNGPLHKTFILFSGGQSRPTIKLHNVNRQGIT